MQVKNKELQQKILDVAKHEFLIKGYHNTSFRTIGDILQISHGNIMNYFKNKKDLFHTIVEPAIHFMETSLVVDMDYNQAKDDELLNLLEYENTVKQYQILFKEINENRELLQLLLFKADTYDYQDIRKKTEQLFCTNINMYVEELKKRNLIKNSAISTPFKMSIASLFIDVIEKISMDHMAEKEIEQYAEEMSALICYGIGMIVGNKK